MVWDVEYTEVFDGWWCGLDESEQIDIDAVIGLLEIKGPNLGFSYSSGVENSRHSHMRELRIQHGGRYSMRSIREGLPSCCWEATKQEATDGTRRIFRSRTSCTMSILFP